MLNIAIDGPAGAGKSTIAKAVAKRLNILCLDTGAMYRALALKALRLGLEPGNAAHIIPILASTEITVGFIDGAQRTILDGEDVTGLIRTSEVSKGASDIGVIPEVRKKLVECQRAIARVNDVIMEGRDICMYVLPHTKHKFFVTASSEQRAMRRLKELRDKGEDGGKTLETMIAEIEARDYTDSHREASPLVKAPDAELIDTTDMTAQEAVDTVIRSVLERRDS